MVRPYDETEGIGRYLETLEGVHALREDRAFAAKRGELQKSFVILGRYCLTEDGRFGGLTGAAAEVGADSADVVPQDVFDRKGRAEFGSAWSFSYRTPAPLAPHDRVCGECGLGWTIADCHEVFERYDIREAWLDAFLGLTYGEVQRRFRSEVATAAWDLLEPVPRMSQDVVVREDDTATFHVTIWTHPRCRDTQARRDALWWAEDFLERAGLPDAEPEPYDPQIRHLEGTFWFRIETPSGPVRFGRKPPGFVIDWKETGTALPDLFRDPHWLEPPKEHGPFHVRPSDEKYLLRHFVKLRAALGF